MRVAFGMPYMVEYSISTWYRWAIMFDLGLFCDEKKKIGTDIDNSTVFCSRSFERLFRDNNSEGI